MEFLEGFSPTTTSVLVFWFILSLCYMILSSLIRFFTYGFLQWVIFVAPTIFLMGVMVQNISSSDEMETALASKDEWIGLCMQKYDEVSAYVGEQYDSLNGTLNESLESLTTEVDNLSTTVSE